MKRLKYLYNGISVLLALAMIFVACSSDSDNYEEVQFPQAALPVISIHPTSADYVAGTYTEVKDLMVKAKVSDAGTMLYQWYEGLTYANSGGVPIIGETEASFTPEVGAPGTQKYYYVVITNITAGVLPRIQASNPAQIRFLSTAPAAPAVAVTVSDTNDQYVRGFGGMSNAFGLSGAGSRYMELRDIDTMFHPETGLGFNILRIKLWYQPLEWVLAGEVEPYMGNQTFCEIVKRVNSYGGYVLASPWTPPPEYKENESEAGAGSSQLKPAHYNDYARHLKNFALAMADYGAPIYSLSLQNEFSFPADYEGCLWNGAQINAFLQQAGNFLNGVPGYGGGKVTPQIKLMNAEPHNNVTENTPVRDNAASNALIDIYAYHTYGTTSNAYRVVQADSPEWRKEVWMTEFNINSDKAGNQMADSTWNYVWPFADHIDYCIRINSSNAYVWWYLKRFYSAIGDNAYGTINGQVLPRGWVMSHWAKYATDTVRTPAAVTGHSGTGNASDAVNTGTGGSANVNIKASAFRRKAAPSSYWEQQVQTREDSISLVIYDKRTGGQAGENIRITLPDDFTATYAHAIISDNSRKHAPALVVLSADGKTADFFLPSNSIMSLKFTKQE
jgi:O-glycosyl hydrolase